MGLGLRALGFEGSSLNSQTMALEELYTINRRTSPKAYGPSILRELKVNIPDYVHPGRLKVPYSTAKISPKLGVDFNSTHNY